MSFIRGELFPLIANKILVYYDKLYCDPESICDEDIIYCDTHQINTFKDILIKRKNLTIITHNSDGYVCDEKPWKQHGINTNEFDGCYKTWYAQNSYSKKCNVVPIPIGFENTRWEKVFGPKTKWIQSIAEENIPPIGQMYLNCNASTNVFERTSCINICSKFDFVNINEPNLSYTGYLKRIKSHKFTISPQGNGLDCHRTWEILAMQRIPVLKRSGSLERLYWCLPVLFVDKWEDIQNIDIDNEYNRLQFNNNDFLNFDFWKPRI